MFVTTRSAKCAQEHPEGEMKGWTEDSGEIKPHGEIKGSIKVNTWAFVKASFIVTTVCHSTVNFLPDLRD